MKYIPLINAMLAAQHTMIAGTPAEGVEDDTTQEETPEKETRQMRRARERAEAKARKSHVKHKRNNWYD